MHFLTLSFISALIAFIILCHNASFLFLCSVPVYLTSDHFFHFEMHLIDVFIQSVLQCIKVYLIGMNEMLFLWGTTSVFQFSCASLI